METLKQEETTKTVHTTQPVRTFDDNIQIVESYSTDGSTVEIFEYKSLEKVTMDLSQRAWMKILGLKSRQIRILINDTEVVLESGALHFMKGKVNILPYHGKLTDNLGRMFSSFMTSDAMIKPIYKGTGEIWLEPKLGSCTIIQLNDEEIIIDQGLYLASSRGVSISSVRQNNVLTAVLGGEGIFQTRLQGKGWVVIRIPVPLHEVKKVTLSNESLIVDGSFSILRKGNIQFTCKKSAKTLVGSLLSREGLVQSFEGTGEVWICPTDSIYGLVRNLSPPQNPY